MEIDVDASRPAWTNSLANRASLTTQARDDQDRVVRPHNNHRGRKLDYLKLLTLSATLSESHRHQGAYYQVVTDIPLSAVINSKSLGRGLSFEVMLIPIEPGPTPKFVAYKRLRESSEGQNEIDKAHLLEAMLLELRVLSHPPLETHPNIISLLNLTWEPDPELPDHAWPILVLEHAVHGTLAHFQEDYPDIPFALKRQICQEVGEGLLALHACDIVHGDVKSENVLLCEGGRGPNNVVAKLADFGCAIADIDASEKIKLPAFTVPWNAPECHQRLAGDQLLHTDVYSYGLLVWRVALDGANPFRCVPNMARLSIIDLQREVEKLKACDEMLEIAQSTLQSQFCRHDGVDSALMQAVLKRTLQLEPHGRDLPHAVAFLRPGGMPPINYQRRRLARYNLDHLYQVAVGLLAAPMSLQLAIIRELEALADCADSLGGIACATLITLYIERLEWPGAVEKATEWLTRINDRPDSAQWGRLVWGASEILGYSSILEQKVLHALVSSVENGCYRSLRLLQQMSPSHYKTVKNSYQRSGGLTRRTVSGNPHKGPSAAHLHAIFEKLVMSGLEINGKADGVRVSERRNLTLRAAATAGSLDVVRGLLSLGINIDGTNAKGETALLQAVRAGRLDIVKLLLDRGADATLAAQNGETALHFLIAFEDAEIVSAADMLMDHGAMPCLFSMVLPGHSSAPAELSLVGSPLHYALMARNEQAARVLLSKGADPFYDEGAKLPGSIYVVPPAFVVACAQRLPGIVKAMLESPSGPDGLQKYLLQKKYNTFKEILSFFVAPAPLIEPMQASMVPNMIQLINIVRNFQNEDDILMSSGGAGLPLLHACIGCGLPCAIIEHLLRTGCSRHLERVSSMRSLTALQLCIYLNRRQTFILLLNHGANIKRSLHHPHPGLSYLQYCASVGPHGEYFARELIRRGATCVRLADLKPSATQMVPCTMPPVIFALLSGAFDLASYLLLWEYPDGHIPFNIPILHFVASFSSRMPVSRIRHFLEPTDPCIQPVKISALGPDQLNCFHSLARARGGLCPESVVNIRYLLRQAQIQNLRPADLLNQVDKAGATPLTIAAMFGRLDLVREMLQAGADPNRGVVTCSNAAHLGLHRLRKSPSWSPRHNGPAPWTRREALWLERDYQAIIELSRQFGGEEPKFFRSMPRMTINKELLMGVASGVYRSYQRYRTEQQQQSRFADRQPTEGAPQSVPRGFLDIIEEGLGFFNWYISTGPTLGSGRLP